MILDKILPLEKIDCEIIVFVGPTGAGKTSSVIAHGIRDYRKYGKKRFLESLALVQHLKLNGYPNLDLDKNLYFCSNYMDLDLRKHITAWDVDFTRLGVPNEKYKVQNLPYGAFILLPELDKDIHANDNKGGINEFIRALLKYKRHNKLTFLLDLQNFNRLAKELREFVNSIYFVRYKKDFSFFGHVFMTRWNYIKIDYVLYNLFNSLGNLQIPMPKIKFTKKERFYFFGNIYKYYDHQSGLAYFLKDLDHYDYIEPVKNDYTRESIELINELHPVIPPDEFKKGKNKINLDNLDEKIKTKINSLTKQFKNYLYENIEQINNEGGNEDEE